MYKAFEECNTRKFRKMEQVGSTKNMEIIYKAHCGRRSEVMRFNENLHARKRLPQFMHARH